MEAASTTTSPVTTVTIDTLGKGYLGLATTPKSTSATAEPAVDRTKIKKKMDPSAWNPFVTHRSTLQEDGTTRSYVVSSLKPWRVTHKGRTTHLTVETSHPEVLEVDEDWSRDTTTALQNTSSALYHLVNQYTSALIVAGDATEASGHYFEVGEDLVGLLQKVYEIQTQAEQDESNQTFKAYEALLNAECLFRLATGRFSLWHLSPTSITAVGFSQAQTQDPWTNFCQVFSRQQLFDVSGALLEFFGLTQSTEPRPLRSDMHSNYVVHKQNMLFQKEWSRGSQQRMSILIIAQMKGGPQGSDWNHLRERYSNFRQELETVLSGAGLPLLNVPTCISPAGADTKKFDNLGNFQIWMSKCSLSDLIKLYEMPLFLADTKTVDPNRPKVAVSKLVNTAAIQTFFAVAIGHLFSPLSQDFSVTLA
jgi:hypothetical protein